MGRILCLRKFRKSKIGPRKIFIKRVNIKIYSVSYLKSELSILKRTTKSTRNTFAKSSSQMEMTFHSHFSFVILNLATISSSFKWR